MSGSFDGYQYLDYLRSRWRFAAVACGVALALSLGVSLLRTKKYSAAARLVMEPAAGTDLRANPIYMESLRTFLLFASSDRLFLDAADRFGLRDPRKPQPLAQLKRSVLAVDIPRDTNVLEITASLPDPRKAHALADYLAERVVELNAAAVRQDDQERIAAAERQLADARTRLDQAESAWSRVVTTEPIEDLTEDIAGLQQLRAGLQEESAAADLQIAQGEDREKALMSGARPGELEEVRGELRSARAGAAALQKQIHNLDTALSAKQLLLNRRTTLREKYAEERKAAQTLYESMEGHVAEAEATAGTRGVHLRIIDPGIVPDRPSSPNVTLNVVIALLAAAVLSFLCLTLAFNYRIGRAVSRSIPSHMGGQ